ncbi:MAG: hypothetical protein IJ435_00575 [Clostridia bacterium]|nr:hypothetical protein [Clostridia bacterium]
MKKVICLLVALLMLIGLLPLASLAEEGEVTYLLRDVNDGAATEVAMSRYKTYQTEHFQIFYDTDGANSHLVTDAFLEQCEAVLENCWDLFIVKMGMEPTTTSVLPNGDHNTQYKTNVVLMGTGVDHYYLDANGWGAYGSVDTAGYPYFMCCIAAMSSPTTVAHEFGHAVHYAQGDNAWENNIYLGPWFEAVANWFAEQYMYEYDTNIAYDTELSHLYLRATHLTKMNGRGYYEAWPILQYLTEDPDNTGIYGKTFVQKLLGYNSGSTNTLFWEVLEECNGDLTTADTVGLYASHMATLDFENKENYNNKINSLINARVFYWQQRYTMLEKLGDVSGTYAVPIERAPEAMGYNIIPLEFTPGEVSVTLNSLTDTEGASWRARLVIESQAGETSYSDLFKEGETMPVTVGETDTLYLTVAATPELDTVVRHTIGGWATHSTESNMPYEDKTIYPYSVTLENAEPMERPKTGYGMMTVHPNGGGRKAFTAKVDDSAYIGPDAIVWGYAEVTDNAVIDGYAIVGGNAKVGGNAYVGDYAVLFDRAEVTDNARVIENACLYVDYKVSGNAVVKGSSLGLYNGGASGEAITYGDWFEDMGYHIAGGSFSGYHAISADDSYAPLVLDGAHVRSYAPALRASYEFDASLRDSVAYSDAYSVGETIFESGSAVFDNNNYVALNKSVLHYDNAKITVSAQGEGDVLTLGDLTLTFTEDAIKLTTQMGEAEVSKKEGFNEIELVFDENKVSLNGKWVECTALSASVREGGCYLGCNFTGKVDYLRIFDGTAPEGAFRTVEDADVIFEADESSGTVFASGKDESSAWYGWSAVNTNAYAVDGGLNITGNGTGTINSPLYQTDKFVLEFEPMGGKAYPDHGITDIDGDVLFAHRYASDANAIHAGRGEINDSIRGTSFVTDTTGQKRLSNFVAEKLYGASIRSDRGAIGYSVGDTVRITAENRIWSEGMAESFAASENKTSNFGNMTEGEKVYTVTYSVIENGVEMPVSVSVYKGSFNGFGGFLVSGGAAGVTVSYKNLKVYTYTRAYIAAVDGKVYVRNLKGDAVAVFAKYEGKILKGVIVLPLDNGECDIPEGFENSTVMVLRGTDSLTPLTQAKIIAEN